MSYSLTGIQLGEYIVGTPIGEGAMGTVYQAVKPNVRDSYVLKVMLPEYSDDESLRKRFEREIFLLKSLQHPHIIPIVDYGEENGLIYFVMPFIRGLSLGNMLKKQQFSPATAWLILEPIAQALTYAHENQVIHRDLKPDNILVET